MTLRELNESYTNEFCLVDSSQHDARKMFSLIFMSRFIFFSCKSFLAIIFVFHVSLLLKKGFGVFFSAAWWVWGCASVESVLKLLIMIKND